MLHVIILVRIDLGAHNRPAGELYCDRLIRGDGSQITMDARVQDLAFTLLSLAHAPTHGYALVLLQMVEVEEAVCGPGVVVQPDVCCGIRGGIVGKSGPILVVGCGYAAFAGHVVVWEETGKVEVPPVTVEELFLVVPGDAPALLDCEGRSLA